MYNTQTAPSIPQKQYATLHLSEVSFGNNRKEKLLTKVFSLEKVLEKHNLTQIELVSVSTYFPHPNTKL